MQSVGQRTTPEEIGRIGADLLERCILPLLPVGLPDKYIAVDVNGGAYEVDDDQMAVVHRLRARVPNAEIWLSSTGDLAFDRAGWRLTYGAEVWDE